MERRSQLHDIQMWKAVMRTSTYGASHCENVPYILKTVDDPLSVLNAVSQTRRRLTSNPEERYVSDLYEKAKRSIVALHRQGDYGYHHN
eukprot:1393873-Pleurochrysis_carterae.AAC.1